MSVCGIQSGELLLEFDVSDAAHQEDQIVRSVWGFDLRYDYAIAAARGADIIVKSLGTGKSLCQVKAPGTVLAMHGCTSYSQIDSERRWQHHLVVAGNFDAIHVYELTAVVSDTGVGAGRLRSLKSLTKGCPFDIALQALDSRSAGEPQGRGKAAIYCVKLQLRMKFPSGFTSCLWLLEQAPSPLIASSEGNDILLRRSGPCATT